MMRVVLTGLVFVAVGFSAAHFSFALHQGNAGDTPPKDDSPKRSHAESKKAVKEPHKGHRGPACITVDTFFAEQVWAKVGERTCLKCHRKDGDAEESKLILQPTTRDAEALLRNQTVMQRMAKLKEADATDGKSRLLMKVAGLLDHGGGEVLKRDSSGFRILQRFVERTNGKSPKLNSTTVAQDQTPFFDGIQMMDPDRLLRRATLSLVGRLPNEAETELVKQQGLTGLESVLDEAFQEDAFYDRLAEGFNDIFLTLGYDGNGEEVLSYDHFQPTRLWYQKFNLDHVASKERQRARWKLADVYRDSIRREPLELIKYIVRNDRPFTELVTADYILVSPYSARGYGVFEKLKDKFEDPEDPFEYIATRLPALKSRNGKVQESETGRYPHAGLLSTFHYLRRYPTTETNRNRLRARMYFQHFLGIDVMELAPRVTDAAAVSAKYEVPTMQAADCVVCHKSIDPVAGLFQDFNEGGHLGPRKDGWYTDMFVAGREGEDLPADQRWRSLQWLGRRTADDPRFAVAMVEHVYYILFGRKVLKAPEDIDDPMFGAKRRAFQEQRRLVQLAAQKLRESDFNLKTAFKSLVVSDYYRVDCMATVAKSPERLAELDDVGLVRLLTPEQLERKIEAVFGAKWGRLINRESRLKILYGGIDSKSVTERATDPSGAMGAIQRILANDVACKNVALDFSKPPAERILFPRIEPDLAPESEPQAELQIRQAIVHLHQRILGRNDDPLGPEVNRTWRLFAGIIADAKTAKGIDKRGSYFCERIGEKRLDDPLYTIRAWRGVVTYLLRQHEFLYE